MSIELNKKILVKLGAGAGLIGSGMLVGCNAVLPDRTFTPSPSSTPTETPVPPTLTPVLPTRTLVVPTATPTRGPDLKVIQSTEEAVRRDNEIKKEIEKAKSGETLILENIHIRHVASILSEGYIATLDTNGSLTAVILSADCIYNRYRDKNQLGDSTLILIGRVWSPKERLGLLSAKVRLGTGTPILNAEQVTHGGVTESCKEATVSDRLREFVSRVDWKKAPRKTGEFTGWLAREVIEGLRQGSSTPTPAR